MARTVILGNGGFANALDGTISATGGCVVERIEDDTKVPHGYRLAVGVGDPKKRREIFQKFHPMAFPPIVHPSVTLEDRLYGLAWGVQIMAGVVLQSGYTIGENVLINFGALIDHDCNIGDHCVISPGAILCGNVTLGEGCFVGAGAIIIQGVTLDAETFVPAGTLVVASDDFRKPQRVVRGGRGTAFTVGSPGPEPFLPEATTR